MEYILPIIFLLCGTLTVALLHYCIGNSVTSRDGAFEVKCSPSLQQSEAVQTLIATYRKGAKKRFWIFLLLQGIFCLFPNYPSIGFIGFMVWIFALIALYQRAFTQGERAMKALKEKHGESLTEEERIGDKVWRWGIYYNPDDPRTWVPRRTATGTGYTVNMARKTGKVFGVLLALAGCALLWSMCVMLLADFGPCTITQTDDSFVFEAAGYSDTIAKSDVLTVAMIDKIPTGGKLNGIGTSRLRVGKFSVSGYGACDLYVFSSEPPYLQITLQDGSTMFCNGTDESETTAYFEMLQPK